MSSKCCLHPSITDSGVTKDVLLMAEIDYGGDGLGDVDVKVRIEVYSTQFIVVCPLVVKNDSSYPRVTMVNKFFISSFYC